MISLQDGYRGIWYYNQPQDDDYHYKYSGGLGTYPQQLIPMAIYAPAVNKTFFCYGGAGPEGKEILDMVSFYDHNSGNVPRPLQVARRNTFDAHYNPSLALDQQGYVYLFCNSHGPGYEMDEEDPTHGEAYIYRGHRPYSINHFNLLRTENFSYSQPWTVPGRGILWLHTRYIGDMRRLFWSSSEDGLTWQEPRQLTKIERGNYQISWQHGERVATVFDYHPEEVGLNARTNIYYLETRDFGESWQTIDGQTVETPLTEVDNPALIYDARPEKLLIYLKDLAFDRRGNPIILYLTARGPWSGPLHGPRNWYTLHWTGQKWEKRFFTVSDHNYDHGSLYIEADGTWRVIAPTSPGPQVFGTGGQIVAHRSGDQGRSWTEVARYPIDNRRNQTYVRRPVNAHPDFYAFWADGNAFEPSESNLYFSNKDGTVYRLPAQMAGMLARPEEVRRRK